MCLPTCTIGASVSRIKATTQTVDKSPMMKTGSVEPLPTYCPGPTLRCTIVPAIGAVISVDGSIVPYLLEVGDLLVGLAENAQPVARRLQRHIGRAHVVFGGIERGAGVLHLFQRHRLSLIEQALALIDDLRQVECRACLVERGGGRNEIVLRLHHVGGLDREQRLPDGHG